MHAWEHSALAPQEGLTLPPLGTPVSALRRARPPPSDVGRAPHTAPRAPPWAFTLHSGCSHHPHNVSAHALSSHRGIGILAQSPRRDQRAGGRRTRRTPPHTLATHRVRTRKNAARHPPCRKSAPLHSLHPLSTIIAAAAPVEGGRVWATNGRLLRTPLRTRGAPTTRRAGADRALPSVGPTR